MSDSARPQRRQPTGLPCPWDSPGKNTGVGCHFLIQCMKVKSEREVTQSCPTLSDPMDCSLPGSSVHGIFQARILEWGAIAFSAVLTTLWFYFKRLEMIAVISHLPLYKSTPRNSHGFDHWVKKSPERRKWQPTLVFLPGEPHGQKSMAGYSPWDHRVGHNWSDLVHTLGTLVPLVIIF